MARETVDVAEFYRGFSGWYDTQRDGAYFQMVEGIEERAVLAYAKSGLGHVLDLGCGTGRFIARLAPHGLHITGVDLTPSMLQVARQKVGPVAEGLVNGDALRLPFADNSFDCVYSLKALPHVPNLEDAVREIGRILRPGGVAVLEFYNPRSLRKLVTRGDYYTQWHTARQAETLLRSAGLQPLRRYGARIVTPTAAFHRIPLVGPVLRAVEQSLAASPFNVFAGYVILIAEKAPER